MRRYFVDYPEEGWTVEGKTLLPPNAFMYRIGWINHFLSSFTEEKITLLFVKILDTYYSRSK